MAQHQLPTPCPQMPCPMYTRGHLAHWIQQRLAFKDPAGWSDGLLGRSGADGSFTMHLLDGSLLALWHHQSLPPDLELGHPMALHQRYGFLHAGRARLCVALLGESDYQPYR